MSDPKFLWRFSPNRTNPETLDATFVQRQAMLADAVERIRESALTGNKHHLLLVGQRGIGKTHFVTMASRRVAEDAELKGRLCVAWLNEDETGSNFLDLLLRTLRSLGSAYPDEFPAADLEGIFDLNAEEALRKASRMLLERLAGRTLLVIAENLDSLFAGLGDEGQKQWRAFLQQQGSMIVLATAQKLFEGVSRRTSPFFGFFQIDHLQPLSLDEAVELLTKIARNVGDKELTDYLQTPEGRARVRALHHLSGGNHRVYIVLSQFIDRQSLDELIGPFEKMLDELTPYYQERLRWLSPQQRKIVEFLCGCSSPVSVTHIAKRLFITNQTAAAQLKILREQGYVLSHSRGRESLYELTEPLMRLSYEVKQNGPRPIRLIVDFLRIWYKPEELREWLTCLPEQAIKNQEYLMAAIKDSSVEDILVKSILDDLNVAKEENNLKDIISTREELVRIRGNIADLVELGDTYLQHDRFLDAITTLEKAIDKGADCPHVWHLLGLAYFCLKQFDEAYSYDKKILDVDPNDVHALFDCGLSCYCLGKYNDALDYYNKLLKIPGGYEEIASFCRVPSLFALDRWDEGFTSLESICLHELPKYEIVHWDSITNINFHIISSTLEPNIWRERVERLIGIFEKANMLKYVGEGLVCSLKKIDLIMLSQEALDAWRRIWLDAGTNHPDLQFGLKLFDVGMEYLMTGDRKVLLELLSDERSIVCEALGIEVDANS